MQETKDKTKPIKYISLKEASDLCSYSQDYLSLRARQGKLKAVKMGRNWVTREEWVKEYVKQIEDFNENLSKDSKPAKTSKPLIDEAAKKNIKEIKEIVKSDFLIIPNLIKAGYTKLKGVELHFGNSVNFFKNLVIQFAKRTFLSINFELRNAFPRHSERQRRISYLQQFRKILHSFQSFRMTKEIEKLFRMTKKICFVLGNAKKQIREFCAYNTAKLSENFETYKKKICQPKFALSVFLIILILLGSVFFFSADARASLAKLTDKSISVLFNIREGAADFVYQQGKNISVAIRGTRVSIKETGSEIISFSAESVSQLPLFIEQTTQSIEELPFLIFSNAQKAVSHAKKAAQTGINGIQGTSKSILIAIRHLPSKIVSLPYNSKQAFERASQRNEEIKLGLKSSLAEGFAGFSSFCHAVPDTASSISVTLREDWIPAFAGMTEKMAGMTEKWETLPRQIAQWGIGQKEQAEELLTLCHPERLAKELSRRWSEILQSATSFRMTMGTTIRTTGESFRMTGDEILQSATSFRMAMRDFLKITVLGNLSDMSHNISDTLSDTPKKVVNKANNAFLALQKSASQKSISLALKIDEALFITGLTLDEMENMTVTQPATAIKTSFEIVGYATANIFDSISKFGAKTVQISKNIKNGLGDTYIKVAEFLIPGYSFYGTEDILPQRTIVTKIEEGMDSVLNQVQDKAFEAGITEGGTGTAERIVTKEVTKEKIIEVTETVQSADLTKLNQDIDNLSSRITNLGNQISSRIDYTIPSYAPVYIPSSGIQVAGHALLTTLNVSGSGALGGSLSVHDNASFGNAKDTKTTFDVYSTATFHESTSFNGGLSASSLGTSGALSVGGNGTISGTLSAATTTLSQLTINNDLLVSGNATTTGLQYIGNDLTVAGAFNQSGGAVSFATTTITGDFTVQDSDSNAHLYVDNNSGNVGIGDTNPDAKFEILKTSGNENAIFMISSTTDGDLVTVKNDGNVGIGTTTPKSLLTVDGTFAVGTNGTEFTVDASGNLTTTGYASTTTYLNTQGDLHVGTNASIGGTLDVLGAATLSGNLNITGYASTTAGLFTLGEIRTTSNLTSDGNLLINGNATTTGSFALGDSSKYGFFEIDSNGDLQIDLNTANSTTTFSDNVEITGNLSGSSPLNITGGANITGGNVGIGTTAPGAKFVVQDTNPEIRFTLSADPNNYMGIKQTGAYGQIQQNYNSPLALQPTSGNVGIGTTSPKSLLTVDGTFAVGTNGTEFTVDASGNLTTTGYASTTTYLNTQGDLHVGTNASIDGTLDVLGAATLSGNLNITGYASTTAGLFTLGEIRTTSNLTSDGNLLINGNATTTGSFALGDSSKYGFFEIDSNGDLQIDLNTANSTTTFSDNVEITGNLSGSSPLNITGGANITGGNVGIGTTSPLAMLSIEGSGSANLFALADNAGTAKVTVLNDGNVGIGTTSPKSLLTVDGTFAVGTNGTEFTVDASGNLTTTGYASTTTYLNTQGDLHVGTNASIDGTLDVLGAATLSGNLNITGYASTTAGLFTLGEIRTTSNLTSDGNLLINGNATTTGSFALGDSSKYGFFEIDSNGDLQIDLNTANSTTTFSDNVEITGNLSGSSPLNITGGANITGGNVGIGTTSPLAMLSIEGSGSANLFALADNAGTAKVTVLNDGNVGIGTTSPKSLLTVDGTFAVGTNGTEFTVDASGNLTTTGYASTTTYLNTQGDLHVGTNASIDGTLDVLGAATLSGNLNITGYASTTAGLFTLGEIRTTSNLTSDGNLLINGNATTTGSFALGDSSKYGFFEIDSNGDLQIDLNTANSTTTFSDNVEITGNLSGSSPLNITGGANITGGNVGIGTTAPGAKFVVQDTNPEIRFTLSADPNNYMGIKQTGAYGQIQQNYNSPLALQPTSGNVGIGTTSPKSLLTVDGTFAVGTNGTEFTVDASGNLTTTGYASTTTYLNTQGDLHVGTNASIDGTLDVLGAATLSGNLNITGYASTTAGLFTLGEIRTTSNLTSDGNLLINGNATTTGSFTIGSSKYSVFSIDGNGDLTIDLNTADSTTTISDNLSVLGYLNVKGSATTTGSHYIGGTASTTELFVQGDGHIGGNASIDGTLDVLGLMTGSGGLTIDSGNIIFSTSGSINQSGDGQVTFTGNVNAIKGLDVTNANLTATTTVITVEDSTASALTVQQDSSGNIVDFKDGADTVFTVLDGGHIGIGTTTPDSKLTVIGRMHASSTSEQLRLTYDLESSKYASFTIDSDGDLTIDLAASNSTTTISNNLSVLGYLNVEGNATTTGSQYVKKDLTVDGQCVTGDTLLPIISNEDALHPAGHLLTDVGQDTQQPRKDIQYTRIDEVKAGDYVLSLNKKTGELTPARIKQLADMGVKPTFRMTTESGRTIETTANHPYLTKNGWTKVSHLEQGTEIAVQNHDLVSSGSQSDFGHSNMSMVDFQPIKDNAVVTNTEAINLVPAFLNRISEMKGLAGGDIEFDFIDGAFLVSDGELAELSVGVFGKTIINHIYSALTEPIFNRRSIDAEDTTPDFLDFAISSQNSGVEHSISSDKSSNASLSKNNPYVLPFLSTILSTPFNFSRADTGSLASGNNSSFNNNSLIYDYDTNPKSDVKWEKIVSIEPTGRKQVYDIEVEGTHNFVAGHWVEGDPSSVIAGLTRNPGTDVEDALHPAGHLLNPSVILSDSEESIVNDGGIDSSATPQNDRWFGGIIAHNTAFNDDITQTGNLNITGYASTTLGLFTQHNIHAGGNLTIGGNATTTNHFAADGTLYVRDGNVGIGTTGPEAKLHVVKGTATGQTARAQSVLILDSAGDNVDLAILSDTDKSGRIVFGDTADNDVGMISYNHVEDYFVFRAGAVNDIMVIDNSGNVGIGTTSPLAMLSIEGSGSANLFALADNAGTAKVTVLNDGNVGIGTTTPTAKLEVYGDPNNTMKFLVDGTGNTMQFLHRTISSKRVETALLSGGDLKWSYGVSDSDDAGDGSEFFIGQEYGGTNANLWIETNGNVGIGTTSPQEKLDVWDGRLYLSDTDVSHGMTNYAATNAYGRFIPYNTTAGGLVVGGFTDTTDATSALTLQGFLGSTDPTDTTPAIIIAGGKQNGANTQALAAAETVLQIRNYTTNLVTVLGNGNVGIGATTPGATLQIGTAVPFSSEKLDVRGNGPGLYVASFEQDSSTGYGVIIDTDGTLVSEPALRIKNSGSELFYVGSNGNVGIGTTDPSSNTLQVAGSAGKTVGGTSWSDLSDARLKNVLGEVKGTALDLISQMRPIKYEWNALHQEEFGTSTDTIMYGFISQEIMEIVPEFVKQGGDGYYWYNPSGFEAILTAGIQEITNTIDIADAPTSTPSMVIDSAGNIGMSGDARIGGSATTTGSLYIGGDLTVDGLALFQGNPLEIPDWNQAYGWGDHTGGGYLTSYAETDPLFASSAVANITSASTTNWAMAYNWGDHSTQNYFDKDIDILSDIASELYYTDGNLGIGTTTTSTPGVLSARLLIQGTGITGATNALSIINASSSPLMILTNEGKLGIATTTPTNIFTIGQGMGNALADGWDVYSSREYKTDITYLEEEDYEDILDEIEGLNVATYRWKTDVNHDEDTPRGVLQERTPLGVSSDGTNLGIIAEEAPERVLSESGKSVSLYDYATFAIAGVKAVNSELNELKLLLTVEKDENGQLVEIDPLGKLKVRLAELGLVLDEEGALVVDKIKAKEANLSDAKIDNLTVGESQNPSGITIYDEQTKKPYCIKMKAGEMVSVAGVCGKDSGGIDSSLSPQNDTPSVILNEAEQSEESCDDSTGFFADAQNDEGVAQNDEGNAQNDEVSGTVPDEIPDPVVISAEAGIQEEAEGLDSGSEDGMTEGDVEKEPTSEPVAEEPIEGLTSAPSEDQTFVEEPVVEVIEEEPAVVEPVAEESPEPAA